LTHGQEESFAKNQKNFWVDIWIVDKVVHICKTDQYLMNQNSGNIIRSVPAATCWCPTTVTTFTGMMMGRMFMA
jgi:hypothetical protein